MPAAVAFSMDDRSTDELISQIYTAATGRLAWETVLANIGAAVSAFIAHLVALDKKTGTPLFSHVGGVISPEANLDYIRTYHRIDPRAPVLLAAPMDSWIHCHERFSPDAVAADLFYQDFLIPHGGRWVSGTKIFDDQDLTIIFAVHRGRDSCPLEPEALVWLDRLRHHFVAAMQNYRHWRALHLERDVGIQVVDALRQPVILTDSSRTIHFANEAARRALDSTRYVLNRQGLLGCRRAVDDAELTALLEMLRLHDPGGTDGSERKFLRIRTAGEGKPIGVCLSSLRPAQVMAAFGPLPLAMLVFHDPSEQAELDPFIVAEVFDLTPAEARIAVMLAQGVTPPAIARARKVSLSTVRSQIRGLMQKTGTTRQSDVARVVMSMAPLI